MGLSRWTDCEGRLGHYRDWYGCRLVALDLIVNDVKTATRYRLWIRKTGAMIRFAMMEPAQHVLSCPVGASAKWRNIIRWVRVGLSVGGGESMPAQRGSLALVHGSNLDTLRCVANHNVNDPRTVDN